MSVRSYTPISDVPRVNSSDDDGSDYEATPDHVTSQQQQQKRQRGREQERRNSVAKDRSNHKELTRIRMVLPIRR